MILCRKIDGITHRKSGEGSLLITPLGLTLHLLEDCADLILTLDQEEVNQANFQ